MNKKFLTQKQVCEIISYASKLKKDTLDKQAVTRSYLSEMLDQGTFPEPKKIGRTSRWQRSDIEQWLKAQKLNHSD